MKSYFNYTLKVPVGIAEDGKQVEAKKVLVKCHRPADKVTAWSLETKFDNCMTKTFSLLSNIPQQNTDEQEETKKSDDENADDLLLLACKAANKEDLTELMHYLRELLCEGNVENPQCKINNTKMTKPIFDSLSLVDVKGLLGRYFYYFLYEATTKKKKG